MDELENSPTKTSILPFIALDEATESDNELSVETELLEEDIKEEGESESQIRSEFHELYQKEYLQFSHKRTLVADSDGMYSCSSCDKKYGSKNHLNRHISIVHLGIRKFPCTVCGKKFPSRQPLRIHMRIHTGEKPCLCEECGKSFSDPSSLRIHLKMHQRSLRLLCDLCGKSLATTTSLIHHKRRHTLRGHEKSMFRFSCTECTRNFSCQGDLECHLSGHRGEKVYRCSHCPKSYKHFQSYQYHRRTHTGEKPFQCKVCGNYYRSWNCLKLHAVIHRRPEDRRKYHCDRCGKDYLFMKTLNFHSCKGSFPCWVCKSMFASREELYEHKKVHPIEEIRKHPCEVCGKRFSKLYELKRHKCKVLVIINCDEIDSDEGDELTFDSWPFKVNIEDVIRSLNGENDNAEKQSKCSFSKYKGIDVIEIYERQADDVEIENDQQAVAGALDDVQGEQALQAQLAATVDAPDAHKENMLNKFSLQSVESYKESNIEGGSKSSGNYFGFRVIAQINVKTKKEQSNKNIFEIKENDEHMEKPKEKTHETDVTSNGSKTVANSGLSQNKPNMHPQCVLSKTCLKCGDDIEKEITAVTGSSSSTRFTHTCTKVKKAGRKKFMPLRNTFRFQIGPQLTKTKLKV